MTAVVGRVPCALVDIRSLQVLQVGTSDPALLPRQVEREDGDEQFYSARELLRHFDSADALFVDPNTFDICTVETGEVVSVTVSQQFDRLREQHAAELKVLRAEAEQHK